MDKNNKKSLNFSSLLGPNKASGKVAAKDNEKEIPDEFFKGKYSFYFDFDDSELNEKVELEDKIADLPIYQPIVSKKDDNNSNLVDINSSDIKELENFNVNSLDAKKDENSMRADKNPSFQNFLVDLNKVLKKALPEEMEELENKKNNEPKDLQNFFKSLGDLLEKSLQLPIENKDNNIPFPELTEQVMIIEEFSDENEKISYLKAELDFDVSHENEIEFNSQISAKFNKINIESNMYEILAYIAIVLLIILSFSLNIFKANLVLNSKYTADNQHVNTQIFNTNDKKNVFPIKNIYLEIAEDKSIAREFVFNIELALIYEDTEDKSFLLENEYLIRAAIYRYLSHFSKNEIIDNEFSKLELLTFLNQELGKYVIDDFKITNFEKL